MQQKVLYYKSCLEMRACWNRQTGTFEGRVSTDERDQVPLLAPNTFLFRKQFNIAGLCKGSTADSDSVCLGSNPSPAARKKHFERSAFFNKLRLWQKSKTPPEVGFFYEFYIFFSLHILSL